MVSWSQSCGILFSFIQMRSTQVSRVGLSIPIYSGYVKHLDSEVSWYRRIQSDPYLKLTVIYQYMKTSTILAISGYHPQIWLWELVLSLTYQKPSLVSNRFKIMISIKLERTSQIELTSFIWGNISIKVFKWAISIDGNFDPTLNFLKLYSDILACPNIVFVVP